MNLKHILVLLLALLVTAPLVGCDNPFVGDTINNYNHNGDGDDNNDNSDNSDDDTDTNVQ